MIFVPINLGRARSFYIPLGGGMQTPLAMYSFEYVACAAPFAFCLLIAVLGDTIGLSLIGSLVAIGLGVATSGLFYFILPSLRGNRRACYLWEFQLRRGLLAGRKGVFSAHTRSPFGPYQPVTILAAAVHAAPHGYRSGVRLPGADLGISTPLLRHLHILGERQPRWGAVTGSGRSGATPKDDHE